MGSKRGMTATRHAMRTHSAGESSADALGRLEWKP